MRFSSILLVLDSEVDHTLVLNRAIALARNEYASITVCAIVNSISEDYSRALVAVTIPEIVGTSVPDKVKQLESLVGSIDAEGLSIKVRVLVGKPHIEITREVREKKHDLVIKAIARRGLRSLSARRADRRLIRNCPCPVWLVNAAEKSGVGCILAAVDLPEEGSNGIELTEHILEASHSLALAEFRPLHIVHAWHLIGRDHIRMRGDAAANREIDQIIQKESVKRRLALRNLLDHAESDSQRLAYDYLSPELHVINGQPWNIVPDLAKKLGAALIVMGTEARSGVSRILRGNLSERILFRSDSSFMIVKAPETFSVQLRPFAPSKQNNDLSGDPRWALLNEGAPTQRSAQGERS